MGLELGSDSETVALKRLIILQRNELLTQRNELLKMRQRKRSESGAGMSGPDAEQRKQILKQSLLAERQ
jgi:hypothetical protein